MELIGTVLALIIGVARSSSDLLDYNHHIKPCRPGEILENDCNKCVCSKSQIFECTPKNCSVRDLNTICRPDTVFALKDKICVCDSDGLWPHRECSYAFQSLQDPFTCKPYSYFKVDCNVCRCTAEGKHDKNRCTKNPCNDTQMPIKRRSNKHEVHGSCAEKTWYSLTPCQFCYCVNGNKLSCNTVHNDLKKLNLGTYNFNVCGKDLPKELLDLLPDAASLRQGKNDENETSSTKSSKKRKSKNKEEKKKSKRHKHEKEKKHKSDENNSETVGHKPVKKIARNKHIKGSSHVLAIKINDDEGPKNEVLSESSNEIPVETDDTKNSFNFENLKFLPMVLDKVFKMALRKSMITVQKDEDCKPGSTLQLKCNNVCICTNDKKMLCTKNECKSD